MPVIDKQVQKKNKCKKYMIHKITRKIEVRAVKIRASENMCKNAIEK